MYDFKPISKQKRDQLNRFNMQQRRKRLVKLIDALMRSDDTERAELFRKQLVELEEKLGMRESSSQGMGSSQSQGLKKPRKRDNPSAASASKKK